MFGTVLGIHNSLRWIVLALVVFAAIRGFQGWFGKQEFTANDRRLGLFATIALDVQVTVGIILYFFLSPATAQAMRDMGAAMRDSGLRFFAVEHWVTGILALIVVHVAAVIMRRMAGSARHRATAITFTVALLLIVAGIPWWRPLIPSF